MFREMYRVLKPGGFMLCFAGARTQHRMAVNIEDAGFELRDVMMWIYGSGFPKSYNIGKGVDKKLGNDREIFKIAGTRPIQTGGRINSEASAGGSFDREENTISKGNTIWEGYGTALKPAYEPIIVAMKPNDGTYANNAIKHGVAGINIDGCRVSTEDKLSFGSRELGDGNKYGKCNPTTEGIQNVQGRFPANIILECTCDRTEKGKTIGKNSPANTKKTNANGEIYGFSKYEDLHTSGAHYKDKTIIHTDPNCPCYILDKQSGNKCGQMAAVTGKEPSASKKNEIYGDYSMVDGKAMKPKDQLSGASRFFYCAKASGKERNAGCEDIKEKAMCDLDKMGGSKCTMKTGSGNERNTFKKNNHPTVKPLSLMTYLTKLVKMPENTLVLDPFAGSGSTLVACIKNDINFIGIELDKNYCEIAEGRIKH